MASRADRKDLLGPTYSSPAPNRPQNGQIWDPTIGVYRVQKLPLALSKSSVTDANGNGRPATPSSQASSTSSHRSAASTFASSASVYSYPSRQSLGSHESQSSSQPKRLPNASSVQLFERLPAEIYDCILRQLRILHEVQSCHTCYARNICALALTCRAWDKATIKHLYARIYVVGHDSKDLLKRARLKVGLRLRQLRRTLRSRAFLAQHVVELKVPQLQSDGEPMSSEWVNLVASVVMACPNLERLMGCYPIYGHKYDRLVYALSTRRQLKQHVWLIGENPAITLRSQKQLAPGLMDLAQKDMFVGYHNMWSSLTTLLLHSPNQGILEKDVFVHLKDDSDPRKVRGPGILQRLPSLQHLCISNFDMDDFDDHTLQHLPPLQSLRLQDLEGVTFWGLSEFSKKRSAFSIQILALVNMDVLYISAISKLLLQLKKLRKFTLVQDTSPEVPPGEIVMQPMVASPLLEFLHWDILVPGSANENLVAAIREGGFPRLRTIRAPSDHYGLIQALCKPRAQIELASDRSAKAVAAGITPGGLRAARRAAQQRLEDAWMTVQYKVVVQEDAVVNEIFDFNGFMGTVGSKIEYSLEPDVPGSDHALIDFEDIARSEEESVDGPSKGCDGSWNSEHPVGTRWWTHQERPRWRKLDLSSFF